jgi:hypothetical protein
MTNWKEAWCVRRYVLPRKQSVRNDMTQIPHVRSLLEISTGELLPFASDVLELGRYRGAVEMAHARTELTHISDRPYITKVNKCVVTPVALSIRDSNASGNYHVYVGHFSSSAHCIFSL